MQNKQIQVTAIIIKISLIREKQIMILMRTIINEKFVNHVFHRSLQSDSRTTKLVTGIVMIMMIVNGARLLKKKSEILIYVLAQNRRKH